MKPKIDLKPIEEAPNLQELKDKFNIDQEIIISYGDKIYIPKQGISKDLIVHEMVHCERQKFNEESAKSWWRKYMEDEQFRLEEELVAYQAQFEFCKKAFKDRNKIAKIKHQIAIELSSSLYGNIIKYSEAMEKLK